MKLGVTLLLFITFNERNHDYGSINRPENIIHQDLACVEVVRNLYKLSLEGIFP